MAGAVFLAGMMLNQTSAQNPAATETLPDAPRAQQRTAVKATDDLVPRGPERFVESPMTDRDVFSYYARHTFSPGTVIYSALIAGYKMALPPDHYPAEWRQGAGGYGRFYGDTVAQAVIPASGKFVVGLLDHEDPRYWPSSSKRKSVLKRTGHAIWFTVVDRSTSGNRMPAFSNLAGAVAGGYFGTLYRPRGYDDAVHAGQSASIGIGLFAVQNVLGEFAPEVKLVFKKLHVPEVTP